MSTAVQSAPPAAQQPRREIVVNSRDVKHSIQNLREVMTGNPELFFSGLPRHLTPERMTQVALSYLRKNPKLLDCTLPSLFTCITEASNLGLELNGTLGHAYIVPFKNTRQGIVEATLIPGYKGLLALVRRSNEIKDITLESVFEGDKFSYGLGDDPFIKHTPNESDPTRGLDDSKITHVYCVVRLTNGGIQRSVWARNKIEAHKERFSKGWRKDDSGWQTAWGAMAQKTVVRGMVGRGLLPLSIEALDMIGREDELDQRTVEGSVVPTMDLTQLTQQLGTEPAGDNGSEPPPTMDELAARLDACKSMAEINAVVEVSKSVPMSPDEDATFSQWLDSTRERVRGPAAGSCGACGEEPSGRPV